MRVSGHFGNHEEILRPAAPTRARAADLQFPRVRLVASLNTESSRLAQDDAGLLLTLPSYTTVGAKAADACAH